LGNIQNKSDQGDYLYQGDTGTLYSNPHAVTSLNGVSYEYDKNGNLKTDQTWGYEWDYNNRMTQATSSSDTIDYEYDHTGQRTVYSDGTTTTVYANIYYNTDGTNKTKHIYAGDLLVAAVEYDGATTTTHYIHTDHLTGSNVVTDENGDLEQLMDYYPFGDQRINSQQTIFDEQKKFTGHEYDTDTDLTYMGARYYPDNIGRFLSQDNWEGDLTNPQSLNKYSYSFNNPLIYTDPTGNSPTSILSKIGGKIFGPIGLVVDLLWPKAAQAPTISQENNGQTKTAEVQPNNQPENQSPDNSANNQNLTQNNSSNNNSENQNSNAGNTGVFGGAVVVGGMSQQGGINTGDNFGKLGTAVKNSPGEISGYTKHGLNQKITRSVSSEAVQNAVKNPQVVLRQAGGNKLYLTSKAAVVLNKAKQVVTTYGANFFKAPIKNIIKLIK